MYLYYYVFHIISISLHCASSYVSTTISNIYIIQLDIQSVRTYLFLLDISIYIFSRTISFVLLYRENFYFAIKKDTGA